MFSLWKEKETRTKLLGKSISDNPPTPPKKTAVMATCFLRRANNKGLMLVLIFHQKMPFIRPGSYLQQKGISGPTKKASRRILGEHPVSFKLLREKPKKPQVPCDDLPWRLTAEKPGNFPKHGESPGDFFIPDPTWFPEKKQFANLPRRT